MVASLSKPVWTEEYEKEILDKLAAQHAPYLLNLEKAETRPPQTQEEIQQRRNNYLITLFCHCPKTFAFSQI
ncbi:hypothetical protein [Nostoc sp.]